MDISVREIDTNMVVLEIVGEIDIYSSEEVKDAILSQIDYGVKNIIIDLEAVSYMDSSGIGSFISSLSAVKKINGKMCIIKVSESVRKVFELTKLTNFFTLYKTEEDAVAALKK